MSLEDDDNQMGWPKAVAESVCAIVILLIIVVFAQCESGRIW